MLLGFSKKRRYNLKLKNRPTKTKRTFEDDNDENEEEIEKKENVINKPIQINKTITQHNNYNTNKKNPSINLFDDEYEQNSNIDKPFIKMKRANVNLLDMNIDNEKETLQKNNDNRSKMEIINNKLSYVNDINHSHNHNHNHIYNNSYNNYNNDLNEVEDNNDILGEININLDEIDSDIDVMAKIHEIKNLKHKKRKTEGFEETYDQDYIEMKNVNTQNLLNGKNIILNNLIY
jgi:hypothetical protein